MKITETSFNLSGPLTAVEDDCLTSAYISLTISEHELGGSAGVDITVPVRYKQGSTIPEIHELARAEASTVLKAIQCHYSKRNHE